MSKTTTLTPFYDISQNIKHRIFHKIEFFQVIAEKNIYLKINTSFLKKLAENEFNFQNVFKTIQIVTDSNIYFENMHVQDLKGVF